VALFPVPFPNGNTKLGLLCKREVSMCSGVSVSLQDGIPAYTGLSAAELQIYIAGTVGSRCGGPAAEHLVQGSRQHRAGAPFAVVHVELHTHVMHA
jgi:hypothetical protein